MSKHLVIVESPAKAKTIKKYLGPNYEVVASQGHVRDLPKSQLGVDPENDFEPKYITIRGKGDILAKLRKEVKKADKVYLATDPDREGEAISWHLAELLKLKEGDFCRISFNEITKNAVKNSIKNARDIDMDLVDAQQARRVIDRVVGYQISPILWEKIKRGLSAGRVQSATLHLINEREKEINEFIPEEYWDITATLKSPDASKPFTAKFYGKGDKKQELKSEKDVNEILKSIKGKDFKVVENKQSKKLRKAPLPFTTSTLQQEASKQLNFATHKTMSLAQQLYEGIEVKGHGTIGLITYLRTDSTRISDEAEEAVKEYITTAFGSADYAEAVSKDKNAKKIQDAHEAIRPTYVDLTPIDVKDSLSRDQFRLYQLIWKRFVASRMQPAEMSVNSVRLSANGVLFTTSSSSVASQGFLKVYSEKEDEEEDKVTASLVKLNENSKIATEEILPNQHFTQPPAHFTEASLVKTMEELGIGRPSTYAPTISTIVARHYVSKEQKNLFITELGEAVDNMMGEGFPQIVDLNFTANMETLLDGVAEGTIDWKSIIRNFYPDLQAEIEEAKVKLADVKVLDEVSDTVCEKCGRMMVIKYGPYGKFLACPGFPDCSNIKPYFEKTGVACPDCGKELIICKTKKGRKYYGCSGYPECEYMSWQLPRTEASKDNNK